MHDDGEILMRVQNLEEDKINNLKFSSKTEEEEYNLHFFEKVLGKDLKVGSLVEKNLVNTRTRSEVLKNKVQWSNLIHGNETIAKE